MNKTDRWYPNLAKESHRVAEAVRLIYDGLYDLQDKIAKLTKTVENVEAAGAVVEREGSLYLRTNGVAGLVIVGQGSGNPGVVQFMRPIAQTGELAAVFTANLPRGVSSDAVVGWLEIRGQDGKTRYVPCFGDL